MRPSLRARSGRRLSAALPLLAPMALAALILAPLCAGAEEVRVLRLGGGRVESLAFSPDGRALATGGGSGAAQVWDMTRGVQVPLSAPATWRRVAFSPDGSVAVTSGPMGLRLWDTESGTVALRVPLRGAGGGGPVAFAPDGMAAVYVDRLGGGAQIMAVSTVNGQTAPLFSLPGVDVRDIGFSDDGQFFGAVGARGYAQAWRVADGLQVIEAGGRIRSDFHVLRFAADNSGMVVGGDQGRVWALPHGVQTWARAGARGAVTALAVSPDRTRVLATGAEGWFEIVDADSGARLYAEANVGAPILSAAYAPGGDAFALGLADGTVRLWVDPTARNAGPRTLAAMRRSGGVGGGAAGRSDAGRLRDPGAGGLASAGQGGTGPAAKPAPQPQPQPQPKKKPEPPKKPEFSGAARPHAFAVVIGNADYKDPTPDVDYAVNDAEAFADAFTSLMGIPRDQVMLFRDMGAVRMTQLFGRPGEGGGQLPGVLGALGVEELFVYYSGHGVPKIRQGENASGFLLPVDVPAASPDFGGYELTALAAQLQKLPVKRVTLILDACFSGLSPAGAFARVSGSFGVAVEAPRDEAQVSILAATAFDQPEQANWHEEKKHGVFTWFALEGLAGAADAGGNRDGTVTMAELHAHVKKQVVLHAFRTGGTVPQTPSLSGADQDAALSWKP